MIEINELKPIYGSFLHRDLRELMNNSAFAYSQDNAFIIKNKKGKDVSYSEITFKEFQSQVNQLGAGLLEGNIIGKRIAIIGKNRYEWVLSYFAALCGGSLCIPLDKGLPFSEALSSLERSYADVLIFDKEHLDIVEELKTSGSCPVELFICMEETDGYPCLQEYMKSGKELIAEGNEAYLTIPLNPEETSIILFTSGTTSMSKAVMLSQKNIVENVYAMLKVEDIHNGDVNMAFLPYHHTFGATGQIVMLAAGATTTFCDGLKYLQKNIVEYKVSVFVCVPLLIEAIYKKIMAQIKKKEMEKTVKRGMQIASLAEKVGLNVRRKIFKEILDQLGGNLRYVISGASAIDPEALAGFKSFGIQTVQGYGMTEAAPVLAAESPKENKLGSIGKALPGITLRIADENEEGIGELIAKGPNIMSGYFENPEDTAAALKDGWLHTGDLASIDKDGFIFIRGRKKNVIVLKNGKNIYPEEVEILISNLPYVKETMVYGQPRHKDGDHKDLALCARIVYDPTEMAQVYGAKTPDEVESLIKKDIDLINDELPTYKHILRLEVTDQPMVKTTTGKVKRYQEINK